jgi:hypothetical protein
MHRERPDMDAIVCAQGHPACGRWLERLSDGPEPHEDFTQSPDDDQARARPGSTRRALERNAGSQFDPGVVRAFLAARADDELDRFLPDHRLSA